MTEIIVCTLRSHRIRAYVNNTSPRGLPPFNRAILLMSIYRHLVTHAFRYLGLRCLAPWVR